MQVGEGVELAQLLLGGRTGKVQVGEGVELAQLLLGGRTGKVQVGGAVTNLRCLALILSWCCYWEGRNGREKKQVSTAGSGFT